MKNNKKGFTLVELLAVIVILAVVILIAVTAVIPRMKKARWKAFEDEALAFIRAAEERSVAEDNGEGSCYLITTSGTTKGLVGTESDDSAYIKKSDGTVYSGVVKKNASGVWTIYIKQTNKNNFAINGKTETEISAGVAQSTGSISTTTCS